MQADEEERARVGRRTDVAMLLRGISDEDWRWLHGRNVEELLTRFPIGGGHGLSGEIVREGLVGDMDPEVLANIIGREFTARLARGLGIHADIHLDLRFRRLETLQYKSVRVIWMTARAEDVASIYAWCLARMRKSDEPRAAETFGPWDWGSHLDSIVRNTFPEGRRGLSGYFGILRGMSNDGFIGKAMIMALRQLDKCNQEIGSGLGRRH
jgi:hypothetical protein